MGQLQLELEDHLGDKIGQITTVRAEVIVICPGATICKSSIFGQTFYTNVQINKGHSVVTLGNCLVEMVNGQIWVNQHDQSFVIHRPQQSMEGTKTLVETCAGIGAVGQGFREHGMHTAAYCENNPKYCSWLRNHTAATVIEGNIQDIKTIEAISKAVPQSHVINGGVSCQPFSSLGDKGEGNDPRSKSFTGLLKAAYHLQSLVVVMECTPGVKDSAWAQGILNDFVGKTGYHLTQNVLEMHHMWPSVRNRWWAVLTHPAIGPVEIPQMPSIGWDPSVFHLMPKMMSLDEQALDQLELDLYELRHFHNQPGGVARSAFDPFKPMPTATHSWGSQVKGCHCGCRASGFSSERVANRGLYGVLIPLDKMVESVMGPYHGMRHPHPMEIALVNGLEPAFVNTSGQETLRLALSGVGQLASPLQSNWVWGNVLGSLHRKGLMSKSVEPCEGLVTMCKSLFVARDELLGISHKTKYMDIFEAAINALGKPIAENTSELEDPSILRMIHQKCIEIDAKEEKPVEAIEIKEHQPTERRETKVDQNKGKGGTIPKQIGVNQKVQQPDNKAATQDRFGTTTTGGVLGFETAKRRKIENQAGENKHKPVVHPEQSDNHLQAFVSPTLPWPKIAEREDQEQEGVQSSEEAKAHVRDFNRRHEDSEKQSYYITKVGDTPVQVEFFGDISVEQAVSAEFALGNIEDQSTVRTSVGNFVASDHNIRADQTYVIHSPTDRLNDDKCPKHYPNQAVPNLVGQTRLQGLYQQKGWVAMDEMQYYLGKVAEEYQCNVSPPFVLPDNPAQGIELARWVLQAIEIANVSNMSYTTVTVCLAAHHWIPLRVDVKEEATFVTTMTEDAAYIRALLHSINPDIRILEQPNRHAFPADCGFQAVAWIRQQVKAEGTDADFPMTATEAGTWRHKFALYLTDRQISQHVIHKLILGGMPENHTTGKLQAILIEHGVSRERVEQCAGNLIENLGLKTIQQVVGSPNAWKDLKIRASQHSPPIKIVLAEELKKVIDERIESGKAFGRKHNKENHKPKASVNSWKGIRASQVTIPQTVFKQEDGELLPQITVHQFHQKSKGIAVVNINEAIPFSNLDTPISMEGVGMIIVDYQDSRVPHNSEVIQFPAICSDTGDSMLVLGALVQLGSKRVSRNPPANCSSIDEIPTSVVRTMVYRDQFNHMPWEKFVQGPVKAIMDLEEFRELPEGAIIDVWDRQNVTKSYQKTKPAESDLFIVSFRCTRPSAEKILESSGRDGVYHEPRTDSGRSPHENFGVVWLPKKSYGEVIVLKQTSQVPTWIVRNGDRYGLRTSAANHQSLHRHHKPEVEFLSGETSTFRVGPLPYGTTKGSLQKVIKEWEWAARPVQPQGQVRNGVMWLVQANQVPPFWVYTMSHGDILITQIENGKGAKQHATTLAPLASQRTLQHLTTHVPKHPIDKSAPDPFQVNDPWAPSTISSSQLANIESQVEKRVMAQVQPVIQQALHSADDAEMIPAVDDRVSQLETQIKQINENMMKTTQSFQVFQQQQMQQNQTMTHQISSVKQQVDSQHQSLQAMLDHKMEDQMSRIEALLVKRMKVNE